MNSGSLLSFQVCDKYASRPNARQIREMAVWLNALPGDAAWNHAAYYRHVARHRHHVRGVASSMHFYGMREAPAMPLRDRGLSGCDRLTGCEQLVKAVEQLAQAEFDHEDRAALVSRPHARARAAGLAISMSGCSARNAWSRGTWSWPGGGTMSKTAQYLVTAVIGVKGTNVTS